VLVAPSASGAASQCADTISTAVGLGSRAALLRATPGHLRVVREYLIDALTPAQLTALTDALWAARTRLRPGQP